MNDEMKQLKCSSCNCEGEHEVVFELIGEARESIVFVCPHCGCATIQGQRLSGEEFYY